MTFLSSLSTKELQRYNSVVTRSVEVRSHFDLLVWLQGDLQRYLPHDILIAGWGDFQGGNIQHDIVSPAPGVRSQNAEARILTPLLQGLFERWTHFGKRSFVLNSGEGGFALNSDGLDNEVGNALLGMRFAIVHGIVDARGSQDCLYVVMCSHSSYGAMERGAMAVVLPYIDAALRQVSHLPQQSNGHANGHANGHGPMVPGTIVASVVGPAPEYNLTKREHQILQWVALGKTNSAIALILHISPFTVKNHMQRLFQKLNVTNRAQAVSKRTPLASDVQD